MKNSLKGTFSRILVFLVLFDLFLTLFFREKQNEKQNKKQPKNATVNYPNILTFKATSDNFYCFYTHSSPLIDKFLTVLCDPKLVRTTQIRALKRA